MLRMQREPTPEEERDIQTYYETLDRIEQGHFMGHFINIGAPPVPLEKLTELFPADGVMQIGDMSMSPLDRLLGFHIHRKRDPWKDAPPWAIELRQMLRVLLRNEDDLMSTQSDIAAALAKVQDDVAAQTTVNASVKAYVAGINQQLKDMANATTDTTTADALNALATQIEANTASDAAAIVVNTSVDPAVIGNPIAEAPGAGAVAPEGGDAAKAAAADLNPNKPV